jgi:hypothetical protein
MTPVDLHIALPMRRLVINGCGGRALNLTEYHSLIAPHRGCVNAQRRNATAALACGERWRLPIDFAMISIPLFANMNSSSSVH